MLICDLGCLIYVQLFPSPPYISIVNIVITLSLLASYRSISFIILSFWKIPLGERTWAAEVVELWANLLGNERERLDGRGDDAVEVAGDGLSSKLVQQARSVCGVEADWQLTILNVAEVEGVEGVWASVATEEHRLDKVHGEDLAGDVGVGVRLDTVSPVIRDLLTLACDPGTIILLHSIEERRNSLKVRSVAARAAGHELVEERGSSEEQEGERAEVEVGVLHLRLAPAVGAVVAKVLAVKVTVAGVVHHTEEGTVETEVVTIAREVIIAGEGGVGLELVVSVQTRLASRQQRVERGP